MNGQSLLKPFLLSIDVTQDLLLFCANCSFPSPCHSNDFTAQNSQNETDLMWAVKTDCGEKKRHQHCLLLCSNVQLKTAAPRSNENFQTKTDSLQATQTRLLHQKHALIKFWTCNTFWIEWCFLISTVTSSEVQ